MKKMNIIYALLLSAVVAISCSKDDYVEPDFKTESFGLYASFFNHSSGGANLDPTYLVPTSITGVMDLSQGELSHEWSFWSGSEYADATTSERTWTKLSEGVNFIKDNANMGYGTITDYTPYLDYSIQTTNSRDALTFMIPNGGAYKLRVCNTYASEITYMYNVFDAIETSKRYNEYITAEKLDNGRYQVVREYELMVYEPLSPSVKIYHDAEETRPVDLSSKVTISDVVTSEVYISAGETLYFHDATGEDESGVSTIFTVPTNRSWIWTCLQMSSDAMVTPTVSPSTSTEQCPAFTFDSPGVFRVVLTVERPTPDYYVSTHYPTSSATQTVPVIIYVL
ncbi:MAG: hypothetical protein SNH01_06965 [Rikenellaceae bacterium]